MRSFPDREGLIASRDTNELKIALAVGGSLNTVDFYLRVGDALPILIHHLAGSSDRNKIEGEVPVSVCVPVGRITAGSDKTRWVNNFYRVVLTGRNV